MGVAVKWYNPTWRVEMNAEELEMIVARHEMRCLELNVKSIKAACAFSVRGGRIVSCGGRRSPLRRRASSHVRGFDFPCTRVWVPLYGQTGYPTRGMHSPYTEGAFSLHGGFDLPTRRFGVSYTEKREPYATDIMV